MRCLTISVDGQPVLEGECNNSFGGIALTSSKEFIGISESPTAAVKESNGSFIFLTVQYIRWRKDVNDQVRRVDMFIDCCVISDGVALRAHRKRYQDRDNSGD